METGRQVKTYKSKRNFSWRYIIPLRNDQIEQVGMRYSQMSRLLYMQTQSAKKTEGYITLGEANIYIYISSGETNLIMIYVIQMRWGIKHNL